MTAATPPSIPLPSLMLSAPAVELLVAEEVGWVSVVEWIVVRTLALALVLAEGVPEVVATLLLVWEVRVSVSEMVVIETVDPVVTATVGDSLLVEPVAAEVPVSVVLGRVVSGTLATDGSETELSDGAVTKVVGRLVMSVAEVISLVREPGAGVVLPPADTVPEGEGVTYSEVKAVVASLTAGVPVVTRGVPVVGTDTVSDSQSTVSMISVVVKLS